VTTRDDENAEAVYSRVQTSEEFQELRRRFRTFAFPMTAAFLAWYLLYVVMSGWARDFMGTKIVGHFNVALVFGLLQFVSTFLIAWRYAKYAEAKFDDLAAKLKAEVEEEVVVK